MIETENRLIMWFFVKIGIPIVYRTHGIRLVCRDHLSAWRADTMGTKEPETLNWIDAWMKPGEILFDIGASTGLYSFYAARRGVNVYAFEPTLHIYKSLTENVYANRSLPVIPMLLPGQRMGEAVVLPNHIKIDTDGFELEILEAARATISGAKTVMIEEAPETREEIERKMTEMGFVKRESFISSLMGKHPIFYTFRNTIYVKDTIGGTDAAMVH